VGRKQPRADALKYKGQRREAPLIIPKGKNFVFGQLGKRDRAEQEENREE